MGTDGLYSGVLSERETGENQLPAAPAVLVALYTRVSTSDQNCEFQLHELQDYAAHQGWQVVEVSQPGDCGKNLKFKPSRSQVD